MNQKNVMRGSCVVLMLMLCLAMLGVQAQSVEEVLTNYYQNTGGLKAWKKLKTVILQGKYPSPQGSSYNFTIYKKSPDKIKLVVDIRGNTLVPQAYDGETAWTINPMMGGGGPQKLPEAVAREVAANAELQDAFVDYKEKGHEVSYVGSEKLDSVDTYVLKLERNKNNAQEKFTEYHYFDKKSYLPILIKTVAPSGQESLTYLSNYQKTEGKLTMPFAIESKIDGQTVSEMVFEKIILNKKLKDKVFAFPE